MARIAGVDLPREKRVVISLQYIYGIGSSVWPQRPPRKKRKADNAGF